MINFLLLVSRQGKTRLTKWYESYSSKEKNRIVREVTGTVLARAPKMCNFVEWRSDKKIVYKRYASLFFIVCVDATDNELITLEMIHLYVEVLDRYFGNVCELDIIFNFHKAYYILDELFIAGELEESSKKEARRAERRRAPDPAPARRRGLRADGANIADAAKRKPRRVAPRRARVGATASGLGSEVLAKRSSPAVAVAPVRRRAAGNDRDRRRLLSFARPRAAAAAIPAFFAGPLYLRPDG
mmetsp:Transcript_23234/g.71788  ORF Transcript_23234/g.71788 Transcript_23234/m.71788 type:complete len:243 (-) Transcript_23234:98-826(-)